MKQKLRFIILAALSGFFWISSCTTLQESRNAATSSCISSIHAAIVSMKASELNPIVGNVGSEWKILNDSETDRLISAISQSHSLDCKGWNTNEPLLDNWKHRLLIAVRQSKSADRLDFIVGSKGQDGVAGTSDDIVSPQGEQLHTR